MVNPFHISIILISYVNLRSQPYKAEVLIIIKIKKKKKKIVIGNISSKSRSKICWDPNPWKKKKRTQYPWWVCENEYDIHTYPAFNDKPAVLWAVVFRDLSKWVNLALSSTHFLLCLESKSKCIVLYIRRGFQRKWERERERGGLV